MRIFRSLHKVISTKSVKSFICFILSILLIVIASKITDSYDMFSENEEVQTSTILEADELSLDEEISIGVAIIIFIVLISIIVSVILNLFVDSVEIEDGPLVT